MNQLRLYIRKIINENIEFEPTTVKEIVGILNKFGIKVSKKEYFYDGSGYGEEYTIIGSDDVDGRTSYLRIPTKVKSQGFISKNGILKNYFFHTGNGFEITKSINEFLKALGK